MNVTESPVVVAAVAKNFDRGRGVTIVSRVAGQAGVEHSDVEVARDGFRISGREVFLNVRLRKALPVNGDVD